jgi:hypothetical protein
MSTCSNLKSMNQMNWPLAKLYAWDLRFSPPWSWRKSSGWLRRVVWQTSTGVCCLIGLVIDPEDGSSKFPGIVDNIIRLSVIKSQRTVLFKLHRRYNNVINMLKFFNSDRLHESHNFIVNHRRLRCFHQYSAVKQNVCVWCNDYFVGW